MRFFFSLFLALTAPTVSHAAEQPLAANILRAAGRTPIAADPRYHVFATEADFKRWVEPFERFYDGTRGTPVRAILDRRDGRAQRAEHIVGELWEAYRKLYPGLIGTLPPPFTAVLDASGLEAYAVYDPSAKNLPLAFFVTTGAIALTAAPEQVDEVYGLIGHELAHLILAHAYPHVADQMARYYRVDGAEPLGFEATPDQTAKTAVEAWNKAAVVVGDFPVPALNGVPIAGMADLHRVLVGALAQRAAAKNAPPACRAAIKADDALHAAFIATLDQVDVAWQLDEAAKARVSALSTAVVRAGTVCFHGGPAFTTALHAVFGRDQSEIDEYLTEYDLNSVAKARNLMLATVEATNAKFAQMRALQTRYDYARMRVRSFEEEADDHALLVLNRLGRDPRQLGQLFLAFLPDDVARGRCRTTLAAGLVPSYGILSDPHHSACYRAYHVEAVAKRLTPST